MKRKQLLFDQPGTSRNRSERAKFVLRSGIVPKYGDEFGKRGRGEVRPRRRFIEVPNNKTRLLTAVLGRKLLETCVIFGVYQRFYRP